MAAMRREDVLNAVRARRDLGRSSIENLDLSNGSMTGARLAKGNLRRVNLEDTDLSESDLKNATIDQCNLQHTNFFRSQFRQGKVTNSAADGANFAGVQAESLTGERFAPRNCSFEQAALQYANFTQCNFEASTFRDANLEGAVFKKCVLLGADLSAAKLNRTEFQGVDMRRASLAGQDLRQVKITAAHMGNAYLTACQLHKLEMSGVNWEKAEINEAVLTECSFTKADFSRAGFRGAKLGKCKFSQCNLYNAFLKGATFREVSFAGSNLEDAYFVGSSLSDSDFTGAVLSGADFSGTKISKARFTGAELSNANFEGASLAQVNFSGAKNMLFARWSQNALESFARTKVRDHMFKDYRTFLERLEAAKAAGDTDEAYTFVEQLERIYTTMKIIIDPELVQKELESLANWFLEMQHRAEAANDPIEAEDCAEKHHALKALYRETIGEDLRTKAPATREATESTFSIGLAGDDMPVQSLHELLRHIEATYQQAYSVGAESGDGFGLDNLLHTPLRLKDIQSGPFQCTFQGEGKGLAVVAYLFLQAVTFYLGNEVSRILQEQSGLESEKAEASPERKSLLTERIALNASRLQMLEDAHRQTKRGQADIINTTAKNETIPQEVWKQVDRDTRVGDFAEFAQILNQTQISGDLTLTISGNTVFNLAVRRHG